MTRQLLTSVLVAAITMIARLAVPTDAQAGEAEAKVIDPNQLKVVKTTGCDWIEAAYRSGALTPTVQVAR